VVIFALVPREGKRWEKVLFLCFELKDRLAR